MTEIIELGHLADAECRTVDAVTLDGEPSPTPSLVLTVFPMSSGPPTPGTEEQYRMFLGSRAKIATLLTALREVYDELESS